MCFSENSRFHSHGWDRASLAMLAHRHPLRPYKIKPHQTNTKQNLSFFHALPAHEIFSLLLHRVSAIRKRVVVFLHRSSSRSQNSCVSGCAPAKLQPELLFSVLYEERCLSSSLSRKPWKSISVGCAAGMIDSGSSKTKERGLHIYVHASHDPAVDSML